MYRLLIVDDEYLITDGISDMLEQTKTLDLDVYKAYSAFEAIDLLNKFSFDIVVSDIQMPGMTGLELLVEINQKWPQCKVIFLTAHDEFLYAYSAIKNNVEKYILKSDGDEALLEAISECISLIENDVKNNDIILNVQENLIAYNPIIKQNFLQLILFGETNNIKEIETEANSLNILLDFERPFYLLGARITKGDKKNKSITVDSILKDKIKYAIISEVSWIDTDIIVWIIQSINNKDVENVPIIINGLAENIQNICLNTLSINITFIIDKEPILLNELPIRFSILRDFIEYKLEKETDIAITGIEYFYGEKFDFTENHKVKFLKCKSILLKLSEMMMINDLNQVTICISNLLNLFLKEDISKQNNFYAIELNAELTLILASYVTKHNVEEKIYENYELHNFFTGIYKDDPCMAINQFRYIAEKLINLTDQIQTKSSEIFVDVLMKYIAENLDKNLTLCVLSEKVYLNPSYLSRRFKELTNKNITDTITEMRINEACFLLENSDYKIIKIAQLVGYESAGHFSKVFKRAKGVSPVEYKERILN